MNANSSPDPFLRASLDAIRAALGQGDIATAEARCQRLLKDDPAQIEAINYLAMIRLRSGDNAAALRLMEEAQNSHPNDPLSINTLAMIRQQMGDEAGALKAFTDLLQIQPGNFAARLQRAYLLERAGHRAEALFAYVRATRDARAVGRWTSDDTTAPALRKLVLHAVNAVRKGSRELLSGSIEPLRKRYGSNEMLRVERCLAMHLGELAPNSNDPRQQPTFLYFPDLPASPYLPPQNFAGLDELAAKTSAIVEELVALLPRSEGRERVFESEALEERNLVSQYGKPSWQGYYFYRHGEPNPVNMKACLVTVSALDRLPLARTPGHAPETLFSVFSPGTHLLPHRGVTNTRVVGHLPLMVPRDCALNVSGELHHWKVGQPVVFDDTYEHEAWNRSDQIRVVLIFDLWNPYLTDVERLAVSELVVSIGDFRRRTDAQ